jgi:hypothetical protein
VKLQFINKNDTFPDTPFDEFAEEGQVEGNFNAKLLVVRSIKNAHFKK